MFGTGEEGQCRKRENNPRLDKPVTSELGNVSPVIVAPGPWSAGDIQYHAENIVSQVVTNAGFNCNAARVVVTPTEWEGREALLEALEKAFGAVAPRKAYYPGAEDQFDRLFEAGGEARLRSDGEADDGELPWALLRDIDPKRDHPAFREEHFCGALAETSLPGDTALSFLQNAIPFCNERLWGTLNASIILHPETRDHLGAPSRGGGGEAHVRHGGDQPLATHQLPAGHGALGRRTWVHA